MDRGVWQAIVHGIAKSWTQLKVALRAACMHGGSPPSGQPVRPCTVCGGSHRLADRSVPAQRVVGPSVWPTAPSLHSA